MIWNCVFYLLLILGIVIGWIATPLIGVRLGAKADLGMQMFFLHFTRIMFGCFGCFVVATSFLAPVNGARLWEDHDWLSRLFGALLSVSVILLLYAFGSGTLALAMYRRLHRGNHPEDANDPERPSVELHIHRWQWLCRLVYRD